MKNMNQKFNSSDGYYAQATGNDHKVRQPLNDRGEYDAFVKGTTSTLEYQVEMAPDVIWKAFLISG